jgi:DNA sulfur modification protein DndB
MMPSLEGKLLEDGKALKRAASKRKKNYLERSVKPSEVEEYVKKGWSVQRIGKYKTKLRLPKPQDIQFEDRVWMVFYNLGFESLNYDRKFKVLLEPYNKQIDIFAKDKNNVFLVECKSTKSEQPINVRDALSDVAGKREDILKAVQTKYGAHFGRLNLLVVVSSADKRPEDEEYAESRKAINLFIWSERDLAYLEELIGRVGQTAKYQLYSVMFAERKQKSLRKEYLALKCKIGGHNCYSIMMPAKELMNYAYIHHRKLTGIIEASQAYQRMLNPGKLKEIAKYIEEEKGFFPNSIIVNFVKQLGWQQKESREAISVGTVTLPDYYGCAWVIDGQHRLYGIASSSENIVIPILAFEGLDQKSQANIFVDINEKQKKVPADLLWDLYSDIYRDSDDQKQKHLFLISETAKCLANMEPLRGLIEIPSCGTSVQFRVSLTTVCSTILKYLPWNLIKHRSDDEKTPRNASRIISSFFKVIFELWPEELDNGEDGVVLSNNGYVVFNLVLNDVLKHLVYKEQASLLQENRRREFEEELRSKYIRPAIEFLKSDAKMRAGVRTGSGHKPQSDNAAVIDLKIQEFYPDYCPTRIDEGLGIKMPETPKAIDSVLDKAKHVEACLRVMILEKLMERYGGDKWWKLGITGGIKEDADKKWKQEISRKPYLKDEKDQNKAKWEFFGLGELEQTMIYGPNWTDIFEPIFLDKENLKRRLKDIMVLRNPIQHERKIDDQDFLDGEAGLVWLSKSIGMPELNPFL